MSKTYVYLWMTLLEVGVLSGLVITHATAIEPASQPSSRQCRPQVSLLPRNVAVILKTASTNTSCKRFLVAPSGQVSFTIGNRTGQGTLSAPLTKNFFEAIKAAEPLSKLPIQLNCMKSASFGTSTFVSLDREKSPDLSCPGNAKAKQLFDDSSAILNAFH
jgi:hypothetical protein